MPPLDFKLKQPGATLVMALSAAFPLSAAAANAGRIDFAVGEVKAIARDGSERPLAKGAEFASGDMIETGNGRAQLRFTDGARISLQPNSQFRIDDYVFKGQADGSEKGAFSLLKGGLRTITGAIGRTNRENYQVGTAVATIGIRGTEYSVVYGSSITVTTGDGIIEICNAAGCLILNSGETAYVANANTRPAMTDKKVDLAPPPPENQTLLLASRTTDSPTPLNEIPTPASQMASLSGTYVLQSSTIASVVGANPGAPSSGTLTASFSGVPQINLSLNYSGGTLTSLSGDGNLVSGTSSFSGSITGGTGGYCVSSCSGSFSGVFTGANASGAALSYSANNGSDNFSGSGAFAKQ
jgi:hypothetical protein